MDVECVPDRTPRYNGRIVAIVAARVRSRRMGADTILYSLRMRKLRRMEFWRVPPQSLMTHPSKPMLCFRSPSVRGFSHAHTPASKIAHVSGRAVPN